jgi:hypothetical protein
MLPGGCREARAPVMLGTFSSIIEDKCPNQGRRHQLIGEFCQWPGSWRHPYPAATTTTPVPWWEVELGELPNRTSTPCAAAA